jgi:hypothetical protein
VSRAKLSKRAREQAATVLLETREELVRADSKASLLLAATGVAVGAVSTAVLAGSWSPNSLTPLGAHLWWIGVVAVTVGIAALGYSVLPRTKRSGPATGPILGYYADMANLTPNELASLVRAAGDKLDDRLVDQLRQISKIVVRKYRGIRVALWSLAIAALLCAISSVVGPTN